MNEFLDMKLSVKEIAMSASRALNAIYQNFLCVGGMSLFVYTKLVEFVVENVFTCCSFVPAFGVICNSVKSNLFAIKHALIFLV